MWKLGIFVTCLIVCTYADEEVEERQGKVLPIFQVVRFPNDVCSGSSRNGTCFTAEECSAKGGVNDGSCASGFGVCCVFKLGCGGTTTANNSYIVQSGVTSLSSPCTYTVCPCSTDVCRIRYDFTTHTTASQNEFTALDGAVTSPDALQNNFAMGACATDQFSISSPGKIGSPIICGTNTGQHMVLDSTGTDCQTVNFNIGASTTTTRQWDIYVTQYTCAQEDLGGPPGCLQFFTGSTGLVKTFGYPTSNTNAAVQAASSTHLQNQNYNICVRREKGSCYICWAEWYTAAAMGSFGLSLSDAAAVKSLTGSRCTTDFVTIPQGNTDAIAQTTTAAAANFNRYCGRFLNPTATSTAPATVCSRSYPFKIGVVTDDNEACIVNTADMAHMCEASELPGGIMGFALGFSQKSC